MKIICTGKIAQTTVGHIDHALSYATGLRRLGHDVYLMEQVGANRCVDAGGRKVPFEAWPGVRHFERVCREYGLWPNCCLVYKQGQATHGMPFSKAVNMARQCDLLITRSGQFAKVHDIFESVGCRAFIDGNPGETQFKLLENDADYRAVARYDHLFTMGLNIGLAGCPIPTGPYRWHSILRPVVLDAWMQTPIERNAPYTTISTWKGRATFSLNGTFSGEKADNWLKVLRLPSVSAPDFSIALRLNGMYPQNDRRLFQEHGWRLTNPEELETFADYRRYISRSRAEFSVAHNRYVEFNTGWFSDRSALYLAAGKPVLVQSTGLEAHLPVSEGLMTFNTLEQAVERLQAIEADYARHCRAARAIAAEYFDSGKVLNNMLKVIGI